MRKIVIAAVANNGVIGKSGSGMLWNIPEEIKHFKNTTTGFPVILGRKTFELLGKPLSNRVNLLLTRDASLKNVSDNVVIFNSLSECFQFCETKKYEKVFIAGGGEVYSQAFKYADELLISFINFSVEGDIFFPEIDRNIWYVDNRDKQKKFEIIHFKKKT